MSRRTAGWRRRNSPANHQVVVAVRPSSTPASASTNVSVQAAASAGRLSVRASQRRSRMTGTDVSASANVARLVAPRPGTTSTSRVAKAASSPTRCSVARVTPPAVVTFPALANSCTLIGSIEGSTVRRRRSAARRTSRSTLSPESKPPGMATTPMRMSQTVPFPSHAPRRPLSLTGMTETTAAARVSMLTVGWLTSRSRCELRVE